MRTVKQVSIFWRLYSWGRFVNKVLLTRRAFLATAVAAVVGSAIVPANLVTPKEKQVVVVQEPWDWTAGIIRGMRKQAKDASLLAYRSRDGKVWQIITEL